MVRYYVSVDAGGTMTDTYLCDDQGRGYIGKGLTNPSNESVSYLESLADACLAAGISRSGAHANCGLSIYAGTTMINMVLTRTGLKVGLLTTRGFELTSYLERALTWLQQTRLEQANWQLHEHTPGLVDLKNVRGISERITGGSPYPAGADFVEGHVVIPLNEEEVQKAVDELLDAGVESLAILFLCSYVNPSHERRAKEIAEAAIRRRGMDLPVVISSDVCPRRQESTRMKSTLLEAYASPKVRDQLFRVETAAKADGYASDLNTVLSYGAIANIRYPRLYETVSSGPVGGVMGAKALADLKGWSNVVCCDLGGTSFDVAAIVDGLLPISREMDFARHKLNLPALGIDTVGAGTGMEIHVDGTLKRVSLGPQSAGPRVGLCLEHDEITLSDANVVLGYLPTDNFLGGRVKLDKEKARRGIEERLARPLGMDGYRAAWGVLEMLHDSLGNHINGSLLTRGLNPGQYTIMVYGGGGPIHLWGIAERIEAAAICTVPWAAAFSAWGISLSESFYRYDKTVVCTLSPGLDRDDRLQEAKKVEKAWRELESRAYHELEPIGVSRQDVQFRYGITARYIGQLFVSWSAHVPKGEVNSEEDIQLLIDSFEAEFGRIYPTAGRFPEAGYQVDGAFVEAVVPRHRPVIQKYELSGKNPKPAARKGRRDAYWQGEWLDFALWDMDLLEAGNTVGGPAIIEHSMTTLVVPPGRYIELDEHRVIRYQGV